MHFCVRFLPLLKKVTLRDNIQNIKQVNGEPIPDSWLRFQNFCSNVTPIIFSLVTKLELILVSAFSKIHQFEPKECERVDQPSPKTQQSFLLSMKSKYFSVKFVTKYVGFNLLG